MSYNKVILIGNLTKDPELRYTPQGTPVASFRLAVNSKFKAGDGMKEEALFIDIVTFGKQAETCSQYLSKGSPVLAEGRLQERKWEKDGAPHSKMEVVAQTVRFLPKGERSGAGAGSGGEAEQGAGMEEHGDLEPF